MQKAYKSLNVRFTRFTHKFIFRMKISWLVGQVLGPNFAAVTPVHSFEGCCWQWSRKEITLDHVALARLHDFVLIGCLYTFGNGLKIKGFP